MSAWLYPISRKAGRFFDLRGGRIRVSLDSFKDLVERGVLKEDRKWDVSQNYNSIQVGDEIYIYTGDQDAGIIGFATVQGKNDKNRYIDLKFDLDKCRKLIEQPVRARIVRRWIPFPRASVINLQRFQVELSHYLPWHKDFYLKPTVSMFKDLHLKKPSQVKISPRDYRRRFVHDTVLEPAADFLKSIGFMIRAKNFGKLQVDFIGIRNNHMIIIEGKTNKLGQGREEARQAFGQLHEYRWFFKQKDKRKIKYSLWVAFQNRPDKQVVEFLEDSQFLVSWMNNDQVQFAGKSKTIFLQLSMH